MLPAARSHAWLPTPARVSAARWTHKRRGGPHATPAARARLWVPTDEVRRGGAIKPPERRRNAEIQTAFCAHTAWRQNNCSSATREATRENPGSTQWAAHRVGKVARGSDSSIAGEPFVLQTPHAAARPPPICFRRFAAQVMRTRRREEEEEAGGVTS